MRKLIIITLTALCLSSFAQAQNTACKSSLQGEYAFSEGNLVVDGDSSYCYLHSMRDIQYVRPNIRIEISEEDGVKNLSAYHFSLRNPDDKERFMSINFDSSETSVINPRGREVSLMAPVSSLHASRISNCQASSVISSWVMFKASDRSNGVELSTTQNVTDALLMTQADGKEVLYLTKTENDGNKERKSTCKFIKK